MNKYLTPVAILVVLIGGYLVWFSDGNPEGTVAIRPAELTDGKYSHQISGYNIIIPDGWFAYEVHPVFTLIVPDDDLVIPPELDGFSIGPVFNIVRSRIDEGGAVNAQEWLEANALVESEDFQDVLVSSERVTLGENEMVKAVQNVVPEPGAESVESRQVVYYAFFPDDGESVITFGQFPFDSQSEETKVFENMLETFEFVGSLETETE